MPEYLHIFSPFIGLATNALCQVCIFRFCVKFGLFKSVLMGIALGMIGLIGVEIYCLREISLYHIGGVSSIFVNMVTYIALGYTYFHFINMGETARRIRILRELYDSKDGLTNDEIIKRYGAKEIIERRINRLVDNGQIILKDGRYHIGSPIALLAAQIVMYLKFIILNKKSEFD